MQKQIDWSQAFEGARGRMGTPMPPEGDLESLGDWRRKGFTLTLRRELSAYEFDEADIVVYCRQLEDGFLLPNCPYESIYWLRLLSAKEWLHRIPSPHSPKRPLRIATLKEIYELSEAHQTKEAELLKAERELELHRQSKYGYYKPYKA